MTSEPDYALKMMGDALFADDLDEFQRLLRKYPQYLRHDGKDIWLWMAARLGNLRFVEALVNSGIDVNESHDENPEGAIVQAADEGHVHVVRWFIDNGAKLNYSVEGRTRCSALLGGVIYGHLDVVRLLVERGQMSTPGGLV